MSGGLVTTKMARSSKRSTKSSVKEVHSLLPVEDDAFPEPEGDDSPAEHSFIYSPSRRRTRGNPACPVTAVSVLPAVHGGIFNPVLCPSVSAKRAESPGLSEELTAPLTRSRRRVAKDASAPHVSAQVCV